MTVSANLLFTPYQLGVIKLRNRVIRAAAFEGMCPGNSPSDKLLNFHEALAAGGVTMEQPSSDYMQVSKNCRITKMFLLMKIRRMRIPKFWDLLTHNFFS